MKKNIILTYKFIAIFFILIFDTIANSYGQGSQCTMKGTNISGKCKFIENCPSEIHKLKKGPPNYTQCSASTPTQLVVCCPLPYKPRKKTLNRKKLRLHEKRCEEYQKYVYDTCGFKNTGLISGGKDAGPKEFPHMAALGYKVENELKFQCGGSLISERFILTAAHCMKCSNPEIIRLGDLNINSIDDVANPVDISVQKIFIHPNYNSDNKRNDIALIKLAKDVTFDEYKRPACLPSEDDWNGIDAVITGWGHNADLYATHGIDHLQKAKIQKFTQNECQKKLNRAKNRNKRIYKVSYSTQVCAGSKTDDKDTCKGDSGGPLQVLNSNLDCMWNIIGITSYGPTQGCGRKGIPGIYTRVFHYIDWIENIVWKN